MSVYASMGNNPVSNVDPDGDVINIIGAAAIGAVVGGIMYSIQTGNNWTWKGFGISVGMGALSGAISYGIGDMVARATMICTKNALNAGGQILLGAYMHGFTQGVMGALQGGDFGMSALTGVFSSFAGSGFSAAGAKAKDITRAAITIAGGGVVGGLTESAMGGNFWNGLKTGLIVAGLNHAADAIGKPKIYKSPVQDNLGKENGECVLRCLEEFSDSFGDTESDFEYWKTLNGGLGVESNKVVNLINSSDNYNGQRISPGVDLKGLTNAMSENKRILVGISHGDKGHAVMISKIKIWPNGRYRIWFAETSPVRIAPYATQNWLADIPGAMFVIFNRKY